MSDYEPGVDDEDPCAGCGSTTNLATWFVPGHGYLGEDCGCLLAAGYAPSNDGSRLVRI